MLEWLVASKNALNVVGTLGAGLAKAIVIALVLKALSCLQGFITCIASVITCTRLKVVLWLKPLARALNALPTREDLNTPEWNTVHANVEASVREESACPSTGLISPRPVIEGETCV